MKLFHSLLFCLLFSTFSFCQKYDWENSFNSDGIAIIVKKGKYGLINTEGKNITPAKYEDLDYIEGEYVALVSRKKKLQLINLLTKKKINLPYKNVYPFNGPLFIAEINNKYGVIDKSGKEILPVSFDNIGRLDHDLAITKRDNLYGLIDKNGKEIASPKFNLIYNFREKAMYTELNKKHGLFSFEGKEIIPPTYDNIEILDQEFYLIYLNDKYGLMDMNGNISISPQYDDIKPFTKQLYKVYVNGKCGLADKNGNISISPQFDEIMPFTEQLYKVYVNDNYGLISKNGAGFSPTIYNKILYYNEKQAEAYLDKQRGYISLQNGTFTKVTNQMSEVPTIKMGYDDYYDKNRFNVDEPAEYPGGMNALNKFIAYNIQYPVIASENGTQGRVMIKFVVEKDGSISDIKILKDIGDGCGAEAVRVLRKMEKWKPAKKDGILVRSYYNLPVVFRIN